MQHLDEGTIHAWLDGALSADEAAGIERHAKECAECAALVADARGVIAGAARIVSALDDVPAGVIPTRRAATVSRSLWRTLRLTPLRAAIAASIMVTAASLAVVRHAPRSAAVPTSALPAAAFPIAATQAAPSASAPPAVIGGGVPTNAPPSMRAQADSVRRAPAPAAALAPAVPNVPTARAAKVAAAPAVDSRKEALADSSRRANGAMTPTASKADSTARVDAMQLAARRDSTAAAVAATAGVAGGTAAARDIQLRSTAAEQLVQPLMLMLKSADNGPLVFPGCYQLVRDSLSSSPLPDRFALQTFGDRAAPRNVVRVLTADGRPDSVITGVTWQTTPGLTSAVLITRQTPIVSAFRRQSAVAAPRAEPSRVEAGARLNRIDCR